MSRVIGFFRRFTPISNLCPSIVRRRLQFVKKAKRYFLCDINFPSFAMALRVVEISPHRESLR